KLPARWPSAPSGPAAPVAPAAVAKAPPKRGGIKPYILLFVVVAAIGAGAVLAVQALQGPGGAGSNEPQPNVPPQTPSQSSTPSAPAPSGPPVYFRSSRHGYSLQLPPGFAISENAAGVASGSGTIDGNVVSVVVAPIASSGAGADALVANLKAN